MFRPLTHLILNVFGTIESAQNNKCSLSIICKLFVEKVCRRATVKFNQTSGEEVKMSCVAKKKLRIHYTTPDVHIFSWLCSFEGIVGWVHNKSRSTASMQLFDTDKHLRLIMTLLCCTQQSRTLNIDRCATDPSHQPLTLTLKQGNSDVILQFLAFDLNLWSTTLTYNPNLAKVKVNIHAEYQGRRSNGSAVQVVTDGQTDGWTLPSSLSPSLRVR